ncbi:MAG: fibronectin type III domain-containing protein, partial [Myxococcota bacterium]
RYVYVRVRDVAGNISSTGSDSIKVDFDNPTLSSIVINNGNPDTTVNTGVHIYFTASDISPGAIKYMMISEDAAFAGASWIGYVNPASYILSSANGNKTVYAKVKDGSGRESVTRSDSIILDNVKPTPLSLEIYESTCTTPIQYTNNTSVCIKLTADDNVFYGTDLFVAFGNSNSLSCASANYLYNFSGCTETPCIKTFNWTLPSNSGYKYVSACVKDKAGNYSGYSISNGVMLDTVPPSTPANIAVTPKSRAAIVSWTASSDYTGSGIKNYIVEYNSGGGWTSLNVNGDTTTATITGLTNGLNYTFRVKAVDYAGNQSGYNTVYNVLIGIARANITVPENISARIYSPTVSYIDGDLFIAGPGVLKDFGGSTLELYKCPVDTKDCKDDDNWEKTALNIGMLWSVFNKTKVITDGSYYYIPAVMANSCIPTCSYTINFFRCSRSNDCMNAANWNNYNIEPSTPTKLNTDSNPMITDGKRLYFAYFYGNTPRIASCSLYSDCTNSANWSKVDLSVAGDTSNDTTLSIVANDSRVWVAYFGAKSGGNTPLNIATCVPSTLCDNAADWTTYPQPLYNSNDSNYLDMFSSGKDLYLTWSNKNGSDYAQKVAKCAINTNCDAVGDWSIGTAYDTALDDMFLSRIVYSNKKLYIIGARKSEGSLYYLSCNDPDASGCMSENLWVKTIPGEYQEYIDFPEVATFDSNIAITIGAPLYASARLLLPSLVSPLNSVAGPSPDSFTYLWNSLNYVDGYINLYDADSYTNWDNSVYIPDSNISKNTVNIPDSNTYYTSTNSVRGVEVSDDSPPISVRRFAKGFTNTNNVQISNNFAQYSSAVANNTLYVTYVSNDDLYFTYCNLSNDCSIAANWIFGVLVHDLGATIRYPQIVVDATNVYISYHDSSNNLRIAICNLSTGCDSPSDWTAAGKLIISASGVEPSMVIANGRVAIVSRDTSNQIRFHYCYTSTDCMNIANWTRDVLVSSDTDTTSTPSLGNSTSSFYILRRVDNILKKYYCLYANGCESQSDWVSMDLYTTSASYRISKNRNMAARDTSTVNQYATLVIDKILKVGICAFSPSSLCNNLNNWEFVDIQNVSGYYGTDYQVDISVYNKNIYVTYISSNELRMARCNMNKTNCFNRDNWKVSSIYKDPNLTASSANQVNLFVASDGGIYQSYVKNGGVTGGLLYFLFNGKMEPEW